MLARFYHAHSRKLLCLVALSFPWLAVESQSLPSNNDVETWLPRDAQIRTTYEQFRNEFGAEEIILIGLVDRTESDPLVESLTARIEGVPGVAECWSPARMRFTMRQLGVPDNEIDARLRGFLVSEDRSLLGIVASLDREGIRDRRAAVAQIRQHLEYCQLREADYLLAGAPVLVAELDTLGDPATNKRFFFCSLAISLALLYYLLRQWRLCISLLALTVWAISLTLTCLKYSGGEMNFILGALSVMVLIFTLAIIIHLLHYYRTSLDTPDPLEAALSLAWKPCCLATLTTVIGLTSLALSDIGPVAQFGYAAAIGCVAALIAGLGVAPALLALWPQQRRVFSGENNRFEILAGFVGRHSRFLSAGVIALAAVSGYGMLHIRARLDALDFLPARHKLLADTLVVEQKLASIDSIEAVVDFGGTKMAFAEMLDEVRRIESRLKEHPRVRQTVSVATFFPKELPANPFAAAAVMGQARDLGRNGGGFLSDFNRRWRISARIQYDEQLSRQQILDELQSATTEWSIAFTGIAPLVEHAQASIYTGFWESFTMAFAIIAAVMIVALRSLKIGLLAMLPNLAPIAIVFGILGWLKVPVDIGMMMTASIALGIAVDGTFHFLVRHRAALQHGKSSAEAAQIALTQTGPPILESALISSIGMLALLMSHFTPTSRFGGMMALLLMTALLGDLVLLPALLSLRGKATPNPRAGEAEAGQGPATGQVAAPKFLQSRTRRMAR